jgi:hypothetical protein
VAIGVIAQRKVTTASFRLNAARPQVMAAP